MTPDELSVRGFIEDLKYYSTKKLTGRLDVQSTSRQKWSIYYHLGCLAWAVGSLHPNRRLWRYLHQVNPQINLNDITVPAIDKVELWEYQLLRVLSKQQRLTHAQVILLIEGTVLEILFDIVQQAATGQLTYNYDLKNFFSPALTLLNTDQSLDRVKQDWSTWQSNGLAEFSPNLAPVLRQPQQIKEQTSANVYKNLAAMIDGKRTLRELAVLINKELLLLTQSLMPYYHRGLIGLIEVPDIELPAFSLSSGALDDNTKDALNRPLIACVDDSLQICQIMEQIVTKAGYNFMSIQDPLQGLQTLIERKPDLIFLDLLMPVVSGYELCAQIRRISRFKKIPIVILTSSDGIVDRLRAKIVGATNFLAKPVKTKKVMELLQKYFAE